MRFQPGSKTPAVLPLCQPPTDGAELLEPRLQITRLEQLGPVDLQAVERTFQSLEELIAFSLGGFDIGYAVLSSLVSITRQPNPDLNQYQPLIQRLMNAAWMTFQSTLNLLSAGHIERVYVFNGRYAAMRAVLRACQQLNVDCLVHERGCDKRHYQLYENTLPHDPRYVERCIRANWESAPSDAYRKAHGCRWFEDRRNRVEKNWKSFVKHQRHGQLPQNLEPHRTNIALFTSSDDEFVAIGDSWKHELYENQLQGIRAIAQSFDRMSDDYHLYLRVHPNMSRASSIQKDEVLGLRSDRITVIPPDQSIDSYALLDAVDTVASFGSSIGVEATYWGKPSILLGPCFYQNFGCTYQPQSHAQTMDFLTRENELCDRTGAIMYGYWFQTHGIPFEYFQAEDFFEGKFKGQSVRAQQSDKLTHQIFYRIQSFSDSSQRIARRWRDRILRVA